MRGQWPTEGVQDPAEVAASKRKAAEARAARERERERYEYVQAARRAGKSLEEIDAECKRLFGD